MSAKVPSAILKKDVGKTQDYPPEQSDRRVSWGNYRVREYLNVTREESPIRPLIEAEDIISAPLGSHSSGSDPGLSTPSHPVTAHMNIEVTPEDDPPVTFSERWIRRVEWGMEENCPRQCSESPVVPITPVFVGRKSQLPVLNFTGKTGFGTPIQSTPPAVQKPKSPISTPLLRSGYQTPPHPSSARSSRSSDRLKVSEPHSAGRMSASDDEDEDMMGLVQGLNEEEMRVKAAIMRVKSEIIDRKKRIQEMDTESEWLRHELATATAALEAKTHANEEIASNNFLSVQLPALLDLFRMDPWEAIYTCEGEEGVVEWYKYGTGFYGRAAGDVRLRVVHGEVMYGEVVVGTVFPSPEMESLTSDLLPLYLSHFKSKTHNQSKAYILDLAGSCVDKLLVCLSQFRKLYQDFTVISNKMCNKQLVTKFSFGFSRVLMATTSPFTLESKLEQDSGYIHVLASKVFTCNKPFSR